MARKTFIAGNWKMNTTLDDAVELAKSVVDTVGSITEVDIAICPPYVSRMSSGRNRVLIPVKFAVEC